MSEGTLTERLTLNAIHALYSTTRAMPTKRRRYDQWELTVVEVFDVAPRVRRLICRAQGLSDYARMGPDEYVGLMLPQPGRTLTLPDADRIDLRAAVAALPQEARPDLRWYTIRALDGDTVTFDVVTHGDSGPGSAWALAAQPGSKLGMRAGNACYVPPPSPRAQLLVADETALPALAAIADAMSPAQHATVTAWVETPGPDVEAPWDAPFPVRRFHRGDEAPGSALLPAAAAEHWGHLDYAWVCGESDLVKQVRRHLVKSGVDRKAIMFSGYWKRGAART